MDLEMKQLQCKLKVIINFIKDENVLFKDMFKDILKEYFKNIIKESLKICFCQF